MGKITIKIACHPLKSLAVLEIRLQPLVLLRKIKTKEIITTIRVTKGIVDRLSVYPSQYPQIHC